MEKKMEAVIAAPSAHWQQGERPPTRAEALAALWRVRLRLGQCPVYLTAEGTRKEII